MIHGFSVLVAAYLFFLSFCIGKQALRSFRVDLGEIAVPVSFALGLGVLSCAVLALGFAGGLKSAWLWGFVWVVSLPFLPSFKENALLLKNELSFPLKSLLSIFILLLVFNSFIPDQFYDVLVYHLALPNAYLVEGKIVPVLYNAHSGLPETAEMLYTLGMGLVPGDGLPLLFQLGFALLILLTLVRLDTAAGKLAGILWITAPLVIENVRFCKHEILFSLWALLSFAVLWRARDKMSVKDAVLSGVFIGLACGTKYTGIVFAALFSIVLLSFSRSILHFLLFGLAAFAVFSPWMVKNYLFFHNPLYPFFQQVFGWINMTPLNWEVFQAEQSQYGAGGWRVFDLAKTFWKITRHGHEFPSMNFIGPVWLLFLPWALWKGLSARFSRVLLSIVLAVIAFSATQTTLARYFILPILPFFALAIARSIPEGSKLKFLLAAGLAVNLVGWLPLLERLSYCRAALWGIPREKRILLYNRGYLESAEFVNELLPRDARILFMGETRSHLFQRRVVAPSAHNEHLFSQALNASKDAAGLYAKLKAEGITHILYKDSEMDRLKGYPMYHWEKGHRGILMEFWRKHLTSAYSNSAVVVYELTDHPDEKRHPPLPRHLDSLPS
ncbi:MAG: hypothetical protein A3A86_02155 [Elusimicrobia bacterium RIFCSPLOWO2_01_FULL_60_11]|nr:MAG: hypothetical protein A3A86_02155 [Elusimicrobia bacterium RIFCSPLOWO2_01_FULL_60_11]